jgi:ribonuclease HI
VRFVNDKGFTIFCDGSSLRGAGGGAGFYVEYNRQPFTRVSIPLQKGATNNEAEYQAVIGALRYLVAGTKSDSAIIKSDSQLVIRQINGQYSVKDKKMRLLHSVALDLIENLRSKGCDLIFEYLPRELNTTADALSRIGALLSGSRED